VFARHNAVDTPALLPDGTAAESSVSRVLAARGTVRSAPRDVEAVQRSIDFAPDGAPVSQDAPDGRSTSSTRGPGSSPGPDTAPDAPAKGGE
jgi:NADH-quinone oxidoreductase subunit J